MNQKETEQVVTTVATLATTIDAASALVDELLGVVITSKIVGNSLGGTDTVEVVAARVGTHITSKLN